MKKNKIIVLVSFICLFTINSLFAQQNLNPHERMVQKMRESGLKEKEIESEISSIHKFENDYLEQKYKEIIAEPRKKLNANSGRMACDDIPASEKAVLQAIFNQLNGTAWATNWDFNTPVTQWNPATQTGWYGVYINENCRIEQIVLSNSNVTGVFPDVTNLTELEVLYISHGMYGFSIPYYITGDFSSIGNLQNLGGLFLTNFNFQGSLPSNFINLKDKITLLTLGHCNLTDNSQLCSIIGEFYKMKNLDLSYNYYSGVLPNCFSGSHFPDLITFLMSSNDLTDVSVVSTHSNLATLWLGWNLIQGDFPDVSANTGLANTILEGNELEGQIPTNFPNHVYVLRAGWNKLEGELPQFGYYPGTNYWAMKINNNKFRFAGIENSFTFYQNTYTEFYYAPQAKVDTVRNDNISEGSSYTMTMYEDNNYSPIETYQWYKGTSPSGLAISGATSRQYTISSVSTSDAGSYYCVSTHPNITIPGNSYKNLTLTREQINLNVVNSSCTVSNPNSNYVQGLLVDLLAHLIQRKLNGDPDSAIEGSNPQELVNLAPYITDSAPIKIYNFSSTHNGYNELTGISFSFSSVSNHGTDVYIGGGNFSGINSNNFQFNLSSYNNPENGISLTDYSYGEFIIKSARFRHINFCPDELVSCTASNPNSDTVKQLFINLVNHLITQNSLPNGYTCQELTLLAPYVQPDSPVAIYNFTNTGYYLRFSFADHGSNFDVQIPYNGSTVVGIDLLNYTSYDESIQINTYLSNGQIDTSKGTVKHIDFCPNDSAGSCTAINPNSAVVKQLFINLVNHLITQNSLPNGYTCQQLAVLAPYVQPDDPVAIYNFINTGYYLQFSFADHGSDFDVQIPYNGSTVVGIDLLNYTSYNEFFQINTYLSNGEIDTAKGFVKHIEFCPDELYCKHHVAIVIDESGSIDLYEAQNVKKQLKSFIDKQLYDNDNLGTNMYVSFIGLSDSDTNSRISGIANGGNNILNQKVSSSNIQQFYSWISGYRSGRVSPSSDYWKSGLDVALTTDAELVILITDGCQTSNTQGLFNTVRSFNNNNGGNGNVNTPHLYVIGIEDGFYVDDPSSASSAYNRTSDPNLNPELRQSQNSINGRVTSYLRKSLKYLMGYLNTDFPVEDKYKIHYNLNGQMVDYYGDEDFRFLMLEPNYISNALVNDPDVQYDDDYALSCGNTIPLENCNNCINFQLDKGKEYILSAWVKEEQNLQVKSFNNPRIFINFLDINGNRILSPNDPYDPGISGSIPWPYYAEGKTKGDIIDGWQRIFQKFIVPTNAVYINVELINKSQNIPAYFDDVRIHPKEGSMKSFVYDPETFRLMSELDENNYSTFYEYDKEGGLIRVKKETSKGVKTIQETRSGNVIKLN